MLIHESLLTNPLYKKSESENDGLALVGSTALNIYSPGISTGGFTEIIMALDNPQRKITATTIDENGIQETEKLVKQYGVESQVTLKLEDVSQKLPYEDASFDFIYARLVLHYLPKAQLAAAMSELHRILKPDATFFVVVRSFDWESEVPEKTTDPETELTSYPEYDEAGHVIKTVQRNLQTVESITRYLNQAGFKIENIKELQETIYGGYLRVRPNKLPSNLIEVVARK